MKNPQLKRAFAEDEYTPQMIMELTKCKKDPVYFISKYIKVQHPTKGTIPFNLFDYQERFVRHMQNNRFTITLQPRQCGKTLTAAMYLLWYSMFTDDATVLIASKNQGHALEIAARVRFAYEELPSWIKCGLKYYNRHNIEFDNGSRIISEATTEKTGRGLSISKIYLDELAFINPRIQQALWSSLTPTLSTGGSAIISSTPNGDTELFASLWRGANTMGDGQPGINGYAPFRVYWQEHPERGEKYWDEMVSQLGLLQTRQEVGCVHGLTKITVQDTLSLEERCLTVEDLTKELISERYTQNTLQNDLDSHVRKDSKRSKRPLIRNSSQKWESFGRSNRKSRMSPDSRTLRTPHTDERSIWGNDDCPSNGQDFRRTIGNSTRWQKNRSNQTKDFSDQKSTDCGRPSKSIQRQIPFNRIKSTDECNSERQGLGTDKTDGRSGQMDQIISDTARGTSKFFLRNHFGEVSSTNQIPVDHSCLHSQRSSGQELEAIVENTHFRIKTLDGFKKFASIRVTNKSSSLQITTSNHNLQCTEDHRFGDTIASTLQIGDRILTELGFETIIGIQRIKENDWFYDPVEVDDGHLYISNGIVSHNCEFLTSDAVLINSLKLIQLAPAMVHHLDMGFKFWKADEDIGGAGKTYLVSIDPATGNGKDFSVIQVFDFPALSQVAEWRSNEINIPLLYAKVKWILNKLSALQGRGRAEVLWTFERNGIGEAMCALYINDEKPPEHAELFCDVPGKYGVFTSGKTKILSCLQLKSLVEKVTNGLKLNSEILLEELKNFVAKGGTYEAKSGSTDDCVMALVGIVRLIKRLAEYNEDAFKQVNEYVDPDASDEWGDDPVPFLVM